MKRHLFLALATVTAAPAQAASYSVILGSGGAGPTSPESFVGFNGALGTLTQVVFSLSGTTTYDITLASGGNGPPPSGTVTYNFSNGLFLYAQPTSGNIPFNQQPYLQQTGSGTVPITFGNFQAVTSGQNGLTTITDAGLLAAFVNTSFSGFYSVDPPFNATLSVNGTPTSLAGATINIASKVISGSVTYTYTPVGAAVPEPTTWGLMLGGLGLVGASLRRRRRDMDHASA